MVFSSSESSQPVAVSPYGIINVDIQSTPLIQGTTVKNYIFFNIKVQILNCIRSTIQSLLNNLSNEILTKVDILLTPLNGQIDDSSTTNYSIPTIGRGVFNLKVLPTPLLQGTNNPNEIVFTIEVELISCNRPTLAKFLEILASEIMDKVNDVL